MSLRLPACVAALLVLGSPLLFAQDSVRAKAVVLFGFDEDSGPATDAATAGQTPDIGALMNDPDRIPSPFWNQSGKRAVQLNADEQQYIEFADGPDVDRPDAASVSLLVVNLTENNDAAYHGLFAKRGQQDGKTLTNYGINFTMQADTFQVYFNDGAGYRVAQYSTKAALPFRKLMYLTATWQVGDAPGSDADTDLDDVRIQLFANGKPLTPKSMTNGFVEGNAAWSVDVQVASLVNNLPVSIGRSEAAGEYFDGVVDEFCILPFAVSEAEALQLFHEVAGNNVEELIKQDLPAAIPVPEVARFSQPGLQRGTTAEIVIAGKNLLPQPTILCPAAGVQFEVVGEPTAERVTAKVTAALDALPAIYPVWIRTAQGLSAAEPFAIDVLPERPLQSVTAEKPAELPGAYFGNLSGGQELQAYFSGHKGQRFVADLELKRLGGKANPVLELKTASGTPLQIAWGQPSLRDDARIETVLPADGLYFVELHDLAYRAPGANSFRLKLGDLKLMDLPFPAASSTSDGPMPVEPVGVGFPPGIRLAAAKPSASNTLYAILPLPMEAGVVGPWPLVRMTEALEVQERSAPDKQPQIVDSWSPVEPFRLLGINGRLSERGEVDRFVVPVVPGKVLRFALQTRSLLSPLNGELSLRSHPEGNVLAVTSDQPQGTDPQLDFTPPENMTSLQVVVRDLFRTRDPRNVYRVEVTPGGRPDFSLGFNAETVNLPSDGSAVMELNVTRNGYNGPIALQIVGDEGVAIDPSVISDGVAGKLFCRFRRIGPPPAHSPLVRLIGTATALSPPLQHAAAIPNGGISPLFAESLAIGQLPSSGLAIEIINPPSVVFRGTANPLTVRVTRAAGGSSEGKPLRFVTRSTEAIRNQQPGNPASKKLPLVTMAAGQLADPAAAEVTVLLQAPTDVAEKSIQFVLLGEAVAHAYSERVIAAATSQPFRIEMQTAVAPQVEPASLTVKSDSEHVIIGKLMRTAGFTQPVNVSLIGLPAGYKQTPAKVAGDQDEFRITVTAPKVDAEQALPNIKLRVASRRTPLVPDAAVNVKVAP